MMNKTCGCFADLIMHTSTFLLLFLFHLLRQFRFRCTSTGPNKGSSEFIRVWFWFTWEVTFSAHDLMSNSLPLWLYAAWQMKTWVNGLWMCCSLWTELQRSLRTFLSPLLLSRLWLLLPCCLCSRTSYLTAQQISRAHSAWDKECIFYLDHILRLISSFISFTCQAANTSHQCKHKGMSWAINYTDFTGYRKAVKVYFKFNCKCKLLTYLLPYVCSLKPAVHLFYTCFLMYEEYEFKTPFGRETMALQIIIIKCRNVYLSADNM